MVHLRYFGSVYHGLEKRDVLICPRRPFGRDVPRMRRLRWANRYAASPGKMITVSEKTGASTTRRREGEPRGQADCPGKVCGHAGAHTRRVEAPASP